MAIVEIIYDAKCKHCSNLKEIYKGKRKLHECKISGNQITLKDKACKEFKFQYGE
jgi:hypothetical protein